MELNEFLSRIDELLASRNSNRVQLAAQSGVPISTINNWYAYNRYPRLNQAVQISRALGVGLDDLTGNQVPSSFSRLYGIAFQLDEDEIELLSDVADAMKARLRRSSTPSVPKGE